MNTARILTALAALALAACSNNYLPGGVRTVSVAPAARKAPVVLAPTKDAYFAQVAAEHNTWLVNSLRAAIQRELAASDRFEPQTAGAGDAEIALDTLRHGLLEVAADAYAVQVVGSAAILQGGKQTATHDFSGISGLVKPLKDYENSAVYQEALQGVVDKIALELVNAL